MASWKDLYHCMARGETAYEITRKLKLEPWRLERMLQSKRLTHMLELDEKVATKAAMCIAAEAVRTLAREGIDPPQGRPFDSLTFGSLAQDRQLLPTAPNGGVWAVARSGRSGLGPETPVGAGAEFDATPLSQMTCETR